MCKPRPKGQENEQRQILCRAMHDTEVNTMDSDPHLAYLCEVASLALAAVVRLTSHKGSTTALLQSMATPAHCPSEAALLEAWKGIAGSQVSDFLPSSSLALNHVIETQIHVHF